VCHQIDGKGAVVGPQLDVAAVAGWSGSLKTCRPEPQRGPGVPHQQRHAQRRHRHHRFATARGRRNAHLADATAEITVAKKEIAERRESELSLMPANFGDVLSVEEFNDLMAFLLAHGAK
jgi:hypothetical protein